MFMFKVRKLFGKTFGPWMTAAPPRPKPRPSFQPMLERLEDRLAPATVNMYWDPTSGANASTTANWDVGNLGSGVHPANAPGNTLGETDDIYFDGTAGQGGNNSCTWDYVPAIALGSLLFANGWNQRLAFIDKVGVALNSGAGVDPTSAPILAPNGNSGANAVPAITLENGADFFNSGTLKLTGSSSGNAIFFDGDGTAGDYLSNGGTVVYTGFAVQQGSNVDYIKVPVLNQSGGVFKVNGGTAMGTGATLQVSGTDPNTLNVSFLQNGSTAETDISGSGTLWCYNNYTMTAGKLQTTDGTNDILKVGTAGGSPVDGAVNLVGGTVNIFPTSTKAGWTFTIKGTTTENDPIVNVGSATLNFKVDMTAGSNDADNLLVGNQGTTGTVNFGYQGGTAAIGIIPVGAVTKGHKWEVLYYGSVSSKTNVMVMMGYTPKWQPNYLEIDN